MDLGFGCVHSNLFFTRQFLWRGYSFLLVLVNIRSRHKDGRLLPNLTAHGLPLRNSIWPLSYSQIRGRLHQSQLRLSLDQDALGLGFDMLVSIERWKCHFSSDCVIIPHQGWEETTHGEPESESEGVISSKLCSS